MLADGSEQYENMSDYSSNQIFATPNPFQPQSINLNTTVISEDYLKARRIWLETKPYTTLEEDFELKLLKDPDPVLNLNASLITDLMFKEDKTPMEIAALKLFENEESRPYARRLFELELKTNKNASEKEEYIFLKCPPLRPYAARVAELTTKYIDKTITTKENRELELMFENFTIKNAHEMAELETYPILSITETTDETQNLSIDYLCAIAEVPCHSKNDFHKNYSGTFYNPPADCVIRDNRFQTYDREVARFREIENAFNLAAKKLVDSDFAQINRAISKYESRTNPHYLANQTLFEENRKNNLNTQTFLKKHQKTVALLLEKIFYDNGIPFSKANLDIFTDYFNQLINDKKLSLHPNEFKVLKYILWNKLLEMENPPAPTVKRQRL